MTIEEAIKILEEGKQDEHTRYQFETCLWTAVDMAIEALEENESLAKSLNDAAELIHKLQKKNEWIPLSERLPEKDGKYLITEVDGYVTCDYFRLENGDWRTTFWRYPIAWMPLPSPYKGDKS